MITKFLSRIHAVVLGETALFRIGTLIVALSFLPGGQSFAADAVKPAPFAQPNILFILVDDMAYNDIGCYAYPGNLAPGKTAPTPFPEQSAFAAPNQAVATIAGQTVSLTPNLDRLATQGVKFTDYHSPASVCSPSRLGLMTGRTPGRFGLGGIISENRGEGLPTREITIAEGLKGCGYATAAFGKWHLGNGEQHDPTHHGFDHYWPATGERATELERLTTQAISFIAENRNGPFFAYFAPHQPHHPNVPHPDFVGSSTKLLGPRAYMKGDGTTHTQTAAGSDYHDVVHELDFRISQLLKKLDDLGLAENTIVIFTSDNGPWVGQKAAQNGKPGIIGTGYPYRGGKFEFWEGGTRVPALIRFPREIPAGVISAAPVSGLDWLPTLVLRGGGTAPPDRKLDGFDQWPFLTGQPGAKNPRSFIGHDRGKKNLAVSNGKFKQFDNRLVNLQTDFTEMADATSANPDVAAEMTRQLASANTSLAAELPGLEKGAKQEILLDVGRGRYVEVPRGGAATFKVSLRVAPAGDLVVKLRPRSGPANLGVTPAALTFTKADWKAPQTVTLKSPGAPETAGNYATLEAVGPDALPIREVYLHVQ